MAELSVTQMPLVHSAPFLDRVQYLLCQEATVVYGEAGGTAGHVQRAQYAKRVKDNPGACASAAAVTLAGSTNVVGTVVVGGDGSVNSSATDAALLSQIATLWNQLADVGL